MRLIYLGGPYSDENKELMKERVDKQAHALAYFARTADNLVLYSPIVHWSYVEFTYELPHDFNFWKQQDFHMIRQATAMWVLALDGWKESFGLGQEIEYARDIGKEVMFVIPDESAYFLTDVEPTYA